MTKSPVKGKKIPPPPGPEATPEALAAYYERYEITDLVDTGYLTELPKDDPEYARLQSLGAKAKKRRSQLSIALSGDEMEMLSSFAKKRHIPLATLAKSWILQQYDREIGKS